MCRCNSCRTSKKKRDTTAASREFQPTLSIHSPAWKYRDTMMLRVLPPPGMRACRLTRAPARTRYAARRDVLLLPLLRPVPRLEANSCAGSLVVVLDSVIVSSSGRREFLMLCHHKVCNLGSRTLVQRIDKWINSSPSHDNVESAASSVRWSGPDIVGLGVPKTSNGFFPPS
jgi:hypothetical protein